jgi:hypothetical protein
MSNSTKVIFRHDRAKSGEVVALFPALAGTYNPGTCSAYVHLGQHTSADLFGTVRSTRLAKPSEYRELARELRRIGYRLTICKRATRADYEARKEQVTPSKGA